MKYLVVILLLAVSVQAQYTTTPVTVADFGSDYRSLLSSPRWKAARSTGYLWVVPYDGSSSAPAWAVSADNGQTWTSGEAYICGSQTNGIHTSCWATSGGMHAFTEGNYYQYVSNPGTGAAYMGSVYSFVGARSLGVLYAKSDNEVWMFRRDDGDMVKYYHTTNGFTTYDSGYVVDVPAVLGATDASWVRVGAIGDPNGDPAVVVMQCHNASSGTTLNSGDGFYYYTWNGTTFDQHTITNEPGVAYDDRYFQFNRIWSVYHVMYFDNIANTMIHLTSEGDSTVVSTFAGDPIPARVNPTSTIVGDTMYLIWSVYDNTSIVMKRYSDGVWDADSTVIVASGAGYAMTVPNAEGLGYVPIWYDADGAGQVDFLRFYEQEAPTSWTAITSLPYTIST
ncbi:MAG: hypothetical protein WC565_09530, partial [Parcubacteria group bacterium]